MRPYDPIAHALSINRRSFLTKSAYGLGSAAFAMLAAKSGFGELHAAQFSKGVLQKPDLPVKGPRSKAETLKKRGNISKRGDRNKGKRSYQPSNYKRR